MKYTLIIINYKKLERRGFEPLTPTLPVLCATNCANAPSTTLSISCQFQLVKYEGRFLKKECCRDVVGRDDLSGGHHPVRPDQRRDYLRPECSSHDRDAGHAERDSRHCQAALRRAEGDIRKGAAHPRGHQLHLLRQARVQPGYDDERVFFAYLLQNGRKHDIT